MQIEINILTPSYIRQVVDVDAHATIPAWACQGLCQECRHGFVPEDRCMVVAADGELFYFHERCLDHIKRGGNP